MNEIHGIIKKAAEELDSILEKYFESKKENEHFYLNNVYNNQLKPTYEFFKKKVEENIEKYKDMKKNSENQGEIEKIDDVEGAMKKFTSFYNKQISLMKRLLTFCVAPGRGVI